MGTRDAWGQVLWEREPSGRRCSFVRSWSHWGWLELKGQTTGGGTKIDASEEICWEWEASSEYYIRMSLG